MYVRSLGPENFPQTFEQWISERQDLVNMIAEGR